MKTFIKKAFTASLALFLSLYCLIGLGNNISNNHREYKNVILMIGDGMGVNTVAATKATKNVSLNLDKMPVYGRSDTRSFILDSTDSAAGGSALACGIRIWSGSVAIFPYHIFNITGQKVPVSLTELAKANGKSAGVVTTDKTSGATPSAFSAHALSRKLEKTISSQQLKSNLDLIWGCESESITKEKCAKNGFSFVQTATQMEALESGSRSFAQFDFDEMKYCTGEKDTPSIEQMTKKAIDLLDDNENGFFLMVEGACIDKFSHDNELDNATMNVVEFDKAVGYALDYAAKDGDTLVVVTADHETGGIKYNGVTDEYYYTSDGHTTADVPLYVSATDAGFTDGEIVENRQISVQIARVMGFGKEQFPAVKGYTM